VLWRYIGKVAYEGTAPDAALRGVSPLFSGTVTTTYTPSLPAGSHWCHFAWG